MLCIEACIEALVNKLSTVCFRSMAQTEHTQFVESEQADLPKMRDSALPLMEAQTLRIARLETLGV
jgi:hypothetical protein